MTVMFSVLDPDEIMEKLVEVMGKESLTPCIDKYKAVGARKNPDREEFSYKVNLEMVNEDITCIRFQKKEGDKIDFLQMFKQLNEDLLMMDAIIE